jgi:hypothetical protein
VVRRSRRKSVAACGAARATKQAVEHSRDEPIGKDGSRAVAGRLIPGGIVITVPVPQVQTFICRRARDRLDLAFAADGHKQSTADDRLGHNSATTRDRIS